MELVADKDALQPHDVTEKFGVTLVSGDEPEDIKKLEHQVLGTLKLSGTVWKVAADDSADEPTIWLWSDEMPEVAYMSPCEASLLIAALELAVHETTGTTGGVRGR